MTTVTPIFGPIGNEQPFFMAMMDSSNTPTWQVLGSTGTAGGTGDNMERYFFADPFVQNLFTVSIFIGVSTSANTIQLKNTSNNTSIGIDANNFMISVTLPATLEIESTANVTPWLPPVSLLTTPYKLKYNNNYVKIRTSPTDMTNSTELYMYPVPVHSYINCTKSDGKYFSISDPVYAVYNHVCIYTPDRDECKGSEWVNGGFSRLDDCFANPFNPNFCLNSNTCSVNNCLGPCSKQYYTCAFNTNGLSTACKFDPDQFISSKWWKSPIFIGIVIGLIIIFIFSFIILLVIIRKDKKRKQTKNTINVQRLRNATVTKMDE